MELDVKLDRRCEGIKHMPLHAIYCCKIARKLEKTQTSLCFFSLEAIFSKDADPGGRYPGCWGSMSNLARKRTNHMAVRRDTVSGELWVKARGARSLPSVWACWRFIVKSIFLSMIFVLNSLHTYAATPADPTPRRSKRCGVAAFLFMLIICHSLSPWFIGEKEIKFLGGNSTDPIEWFWFPRPPPPSPGKTDVLDGCPHYVNVVKFLP